MTPASSINRMEATVRGVVLIGFLVGALLAAAPAFAQDPAIPHGVTIQGVPVGDMTAADAKEAVHAFAAAPFTLSFRTRTLQATPWQLGVKSRINLAVAQAFAAQPDSDVPLTVSIDFDQFRHYTEKLDKLLSRKPRETHVRLRHRRPHLSKSHNGYNVQQRPTRTLLKHAIRANLRGPVAIEYRTIRPDVTRWNFKPVVVIRRGSHLLYLYKGAHMRRRGRFGVAVGQPIYPTPIGKFTIVTKQKNPWWYPPDSAWAAGASPIPPGPGNPLGTRWMGLSVSGVGIHGTPDAASIGYSASHGCIRMRIPDAEWLFKRVEVGSTVFIVRR
jgi:lipoprotein-anchoring transpeptidase ErfK/SrfK